MVGLLIVGLPMAYKTAIDQGPDLAGFCDAGRYILEHGTRMPDSTLARYWPSADVPWILFAMLPISVAAVLWYCIGCATWLGLLRTICDRMLVGLDSTAKRHATLAAGLLAMPLALDGMRMGSFHVLMVWLMILGLDRACRGEETTGGILLGTGAWLKLLPLLGIGFLFYQRKWKGALIALATVIVLDVGLSVAAYGPAGAWREHVLWWQCGATGTANRQLTSDRPTDEDRLTNQSVAITLRRLLTSLGCQPAAQSKPDQAALPIDPQKSNAASPTKGRPENRQFEFASCIGCLSPNKPVGQESLTYGTEMKSTHDLDTEPPALKRERLANVKARRRVQLADLAPAQLHIVFLATMAIRALGVAIYCRPIRSAGTDRASSLHGRRSSRTEEIPAKIAMMTLATLWFSPVVWSYHFVAAAPALAILFLRGRYRWQWIAPTIAVWVGSLGLLAFDVARVAGVLLWMSLLLGVGLVVFPVVDDTERSCENPERALDCAAPEPVLG